jgi:hypothetical protein
MCIRQILTVLARAQDIVDLALVKPGDAVKSPAYPDNPFDLFSQSSREKIRRE